MKGEEDTWTEYQWETSVTAEQIRGSPALAAVIRSGRQFPFPFIWLLYSDYEKTITFTKNLPHTACQ
jgi:hypothetical protein